MVFASMEECAMIERLDLGTELNTKFDSSTMRDLVISLAIFVGVFVVCALIGLAFTENFYAGIFVVSLVVATIALICRRVWINPRGGPFFAIATVPVSAVIFLIIANIWGLTPLLFLVGFIAFICFWEVFSPV